MHRLVFDIDVPKITHDEALVIMNRDYCELLDIIHDVFDIDSVHTYCSSGYDDGSYKISLHVYADAFVGSLSTMKRVVK